MRVPVLFLALFLVLAGCAKDGSDTESADQATPAAEQTPDAAEIAADTPADAPDEDALLHKADPVGSYGTALPDTEPLTATAVLATAEAREGERVVVEGTVSAVCPMRGCWIEVRDPATGEELRVKVKDGEIVFPLSAVDHPIRVAGTVERLELTQEEARDWMAHEAEELGEEFDPASVTGPVTIWRLRGEGAEIEAHS